MSAQRTVNFDILSSKYLPCCTGISPSSVDELRYSLPHKLSDDGGLRPATLLHARAAHHGGQERASRDEANGSSNYLISTPSLLGSGIMLSSNAESTRPVETPATSVPTEQQVSLRSPLLGANVTGVSPPITDLNPSRVKYQDGMQPTLASDVADEGLLTTDNNYAPIQLHSLNASATVAPHTESLMATDDIDAALEQNSAGAGEALAETSGSKMNSIADDSLAHPAMEITSAEELEDPVQPSLIVTAGQTSQVQDENDTAILTTSLPISMTSEASQTASPPPPKDSFIYSGSSEGLQDAAASL